MVVAIGDNGQGRIWQARRSATAVAFFSTPSNSAPNFSVMNEPADPNKPRLVPSNLASDLSVMNRLAIARHCDRRANPGHHAALARRLITLSPRFPPYPSADIEDWSQAQLPPFPDGSTGRTDARIDRATRSRTSDSDTLLTWALPNNAMASSRLTLERYPGVVLNKRSCAFVRSVKSALPGASSTRAQGPQP